MAAALEQPEVRKGGMRALPEANRGIGAHDPGAVSLWDVDRRVPKRVAPLDTDAVEVRMRHRDPAKTAAFPHGGNALVIDVSEAVPQQVALRRLHQEGTLANADRGLRPNAG